MTITEQKLRWKRFALRPGTETGKKAVERLAPDLIRLKARPDSVDDAGVARLHAALVAEGRENAAAQINSFIMGYNARTRGARLARLPNEADRREEAARALCGPELLAEIDALVSRCAASAAVDGLRAGIVRMVGLLPRQGPPILTLSDLLTQEAIAEIGYRAPTTSGVERGPSLASAGRAPRAGGRLGVRGRRRAEAAAAISISKLAEPSQARLNEPIEGAPIGVAGEQSVAIDQVEERHRLAAQGVDDVAIIDDMAMLALAL